MQAGRWQKNFHQADFRKQDYLFFGLNIKNLLSDPSPSIRKLASVMDLLSIYFLQYHLGSCATKISKKGIIVFLKKAARDFEAKVCISTFATYELKWWFHIIPSAIYTT